MTIEYKDSKRIVGLSTESLLTSSDYTSSNFTTVGSTVAITNNSVVFSSTPTNADNGQYEQITALAESDSYTLDFKLNVSSHATFDNYYLALTNTSGAINSANQLGLQTQGGSYNRFTFSTRISGSSSETASSNGTVSTGTDYYCTLSSDGTTATFKAWTNSGRTGTASVTLTRPVSGLGTLNYIQHRSRNSGDSNTWSGTVSEVALSRTPAKPTNVQDNSILVEKDTARRYWFSKAPVATDDYTSNKGYVKDSSSNWVLPTGGKIDFETITRSTTSQEMYIDLQDSDYLGENLSDTNWTVKFGKFKVVNEATSSGNVLLHICLSNTNGSSGGTQQTHSCAVNFSQSEGGYTNYCTTGNLHGSGASQQNITGTAGMADGDERYIEMSRSGNDFTVKICSDANYSTVLGSGTQTKTGISGLRYLKFVNDSEQNASLTASAELFGGLEIINGNDTWTMQPTKQFDFSSSIGWVPVGSGCSVTGGKLDCNAFSSNADNRIYGDIGFELSDKFVARFEYNPVSATNGAYWLMWGISDNTNAILGSLSSAVQDNVFCWVDMGSYTVYLRDRNGSSIGTNVGSVDLTQGTTYFIEYIRNGSSSTIYFREGSHTGTLTGSLTTTINGTVDGLRYFQTGSMTGNGGTVSQQIDNLEIYNGVTSIN